ncbi:MAG: hypothetical protein BroJett022_15110 [Actinomycetes bacterium]|nr:MAG: hypothetical protein BroJett022_15110 [Actinomycetes bacterium]
MAEDGARPAEQDRSHPVSLDGEATVPDRIYPAMDAVKPPGGAALADRAATETQILELGGGDDAVLLPRDLGNLGVTRVNVTKRNQGFRNVAFTGHGAIVAPAGAPLNAEMCRTGGDPGPKA